MALPAGRRVASSAEPHGALMLTITEAAGDGVATADNRWRQPSSVPTIAPTITGANSDCRKPLALVTVDSRR